MIDVFDQRFEFFVEVFGGRFQSGNLHQQLVDLFVLLQRFGNEALSFAINCLQSRIEDFFLNSRMQLEFATNLRKDLILYVVSRPAGSIELAEKTFDRRMVFLEQLESI